LVDEPVVAVPVANIDDSLFGLSVAVSDPDEMRLCALLHGALRHQDRVRAHGTLDFDAHELPRSQYTLRVGEHGTNLEGAGVLGERRVGETDLALIRVNRTVGKDYVHVVIVVFRRSQQTL